MFQKDFQGISKDFQAMLVKYRTGTYCDKHSILTKGVRVAYYEIIDFKEELGVYHGIETELMRNRDGELFCPECRRNGAIKEKMDAFQKVAYEREAILKEKSMISQTSSVLKKKSIIADETVKSATFNNFTTNDDGTKMLKEKAFSYANEILNGATNTFVFAGLAGRGKSHLSMAILNYVNNQSYKNHLENSESKPFKCLYVSIPRMMSLISETYNMSWEKKEAYPFTEERVIELIRTSDVVVFDDLGAELGRINESTRANDTVTVRLMKAFDARQGKPTIVSTNLTEKQMKQVYTEPVASRINSNTIGLVFNDTTDKRGEKK